MRTSQRPPGTKSRRWGRRSAALCGAVIALLLVPVSYLAVDPFDRYSDVRIIRPQGAVVLTDGAATLSWDAETLSRLDD